MVGNWALEVRMLKDTSSFWRSTPKGRKTTAFTREKMVVFAPMPRASVTTAAAVTPGLERSRRKAQVRLWRSISVREGTFAAAEKLIFSIPSRRPLPDCGTHPPRFGHLAPHSRRAQIDKSQ